MIFPIGISALSVNPAASHAPPGPAPASQRHRSSEIGYFRETTSPPLRHPKDPSRGMPAGARGDSVTASTSKPAHHRPSLCRPDQGARILVKAARGGRLVQCENAGTRNGHFTAVRPQMGVLDKRTVRGQGAGSGGEAQFMIGYVWRGNGHGVSLPGRASPNF